MNIWNLLFIIWSGQFIATVRVISKFRLNLMFDLGTTRAIIVIHTTSAVFEDKIALTSIESTVLVWLRSLTCCILIHKTVGSYSSRVFVGRLFSRFLIHTSSIDAHISSMIL